MSRLTADPSPVSESVQSTKATASAWPRLNVYGPPTTSLTWIAADAGVALATNIATIKSALPKKRQRAITDSF